MYLLLVVIVYIIFAVVFVDWKRWKDYYPTIQYYLICNLTYNFLFYNHTLWAYKAVTVEWLNHTLIELTFSFIILPVVLMMYLRYYPNGKNSVIYIAAWVAYFTFLEYIFYKRGLFVYDNGWGPSWSLLFNIIMFVMIRLHFKNKLLALIVSVPLIAVLLLIFHPSLEDMK
ncbi:CBO0543 family protein [Bacillus sp. SCS-153A]|uniref:CBO0543 family protein n=1 Tax=Rossellomorea sedimentorum TaxID=3115294 RepID=UPI0039068504